MQQSCCCCHERMNTNYLSMLYIKHDNATHKSELDDALTGEGTWIINIQCNLNVTVLHARMDEMKVK